VRVFNDRGQFLAGTHVTGTIRSGVICVNEGGWFDPENSRQSGSLDRCGDVNNVTTGIGTSRVAQGDCGHTPVGDVEKYRSAPPDADVFRAPGASVKYRGSD
jgi:trimethylamine-N-oxide reductase (cytochrome c)